MIIYKAYLLHLSNRELVRLYVCGYYINPSLKVQLKLLAEGLKWSWSFWKANGNNIY